MSELPIGVESRMFAKETSDLTEKIDKISEQIKTGTEDKDLEVWNQVIENQKKGFDKRISELEGELTQFKRGYMIYVSKILIEIDKIKEKQEMTFESVEYKGYADILESIDKIYELSKKQMER